MIKSSRPHLFLLAIVSIIFLLFTIVNCNNNNHDQMETILYEKRLAASAADQFYDLLEQDNSNDEDIAIITRNSLKPFPDRRSQFHAMRGKRRVIIS